MQPATHSVMARRFWLDAALVLLLAGASLVWGDALTWSDDRNYKMLATFGSVEAWRVP